MAPSSSTTSLRARVTRSAFTVGQRRSTHRASPCSTRRLHQLHRSIPRSKSSQASTTCPCETASRLPPPCACHRERPRSHRVHSQPSLSTRVTEPLRPGRCSIATWASTPEITPCSPTPQLLLVPLLDQHLATPLFLCRCVALDAPVVHLTSSVLQSQPTAMTPSKKSPHSRLWPTTRSDSSASPTPASANSAQQDSTHLALPQSLRSAQLKTSTPPAHLAESPTPDSLLVGLPTECTMRSQRQQQLVSTGPGQRFKLATRPVPPTSSSTIRLKMSKASWPTHLTECQRSTTLAHRLLGHPRSRFPSFWLVHSKTSRPVLSGLTSSERSPKTKTSTPPCRTAPTLTHLPQTS